MRSLVDHRAGDRIGRARSRITRGGLALGLLGVLIISGGSAAASTPGAHAASEHPLGAFAWLMPNDAPPAWRRAVLPSGAAQVSYPPTFAPLAGDSGTVSAAARALDGTIRAYVNATPRQGDEALKGFGALRVRLLRREDVTVHQDANVEGLAFRGGRVSCVSDHYITRIGHHRYREVACLADGRHGAAVVVVAATLARWQEFQPLLREVVASFTVR